MLRLPAALALAAICAAAPAAPVASQAQTPAAAAACSTPLVPVVPASGDAPIVRVLYFAGGSTRADDPQLTEAVSFEVAEQLSRAIGIAVVHGDQWLHAGGTPTYMLSGHVARARDQLTVRVRLNEASSGTTLWSTDVTGAVLEMPAVAARIATEAADEMGGTLIPGPVRRIGIPLPAFDQLLLGRYNLARWDHASMQRATRALAMSAGLAGGDPSTYAGYAAALGKMGEWGYPSHAPADSLLAWASLASELAGDRFAARGEQRAAAAAFGQSASYAALHGDTDRARELALQSGALQPGQPDAERALALIEMPATPWTAASRLAALPAGASASVLIDQAMLALSTGQDADACRILESVIASDPRFAPAFALRSLARFRNGDMRGGWADADMARQLGRALWGDALELLAATRVSERQELVPRVNRYVSLVGADSSELSVLDGRLAIIALTAAGRDVEARRILARVRPTDPRRALTLGERGVQD